MNLHLILLQASIALAPETVDHHECVSKLASITSFESYWNEKIRPHRPGWNSIEVNAPTNTELSHHDKIKRQIWHAQMSWESNGPEFERFLASRYTHKECIETVSFLSSTSGHKLMMDQQLYKNLMDKFFTGALKSFNEMIDLEDKRYQNYLNRLNGEKKT